MKTSDLLAALVVAAVAYFVWQSTKSAAAQQPAPEWQPDWRMGSSPDFSGVLR